MRLLLRVFLFSIIAILLAAVGAVFLAIDDHAVVNRSAEITPENIARAKYLLQTHDPRKLKAGDRQRVSLSGEDIDLIANYLVNRYGRGSARAVLKPGTLQLTASTNLPDNPIGNFFNIDAAFNATGGLPRVERVRLGQLPVPAWIANLVLARALTKVREDTHYAFAADIIKDVEISEGKMEVTYEWQSGLPDKMRTALLPPASQELLRVYHARLAEQTRTHSGAASLTTLLVPLLTFAQERSAGRDPAIENSAAIVVLALYLSGTDVTTLIPSASRWPHPSEKTVTLNGREDLSKHFMISAALAAGAGGPFSDAVGLYKEVRDSRSGSGFSFTDIAADRAGTRFGELATSGQASARKLQQQLNGDVPESSLMPATSDLPEFMPEVEFKSRFGGVGSATYNAMMNEIERRIALLPLYR